jgi:hypothetical protein
LIVNSKIADIHRVRSAAGRAGAISRWQGVDREPTVQVRVYADDADWLKARPGTVAENVRAICEEKRAAIGYESVDVEHDKTEIIKHAIELRAAATSGDWKLPRGMADAVNAICDAVWELEEDRRILEESQEGDNK